MGLPERAGFSAGNFLEIFCGAFNSLCYIHALSNGVGLGQPGERHRVPWDAQRTDCDYEEKDDQKDAGKSAGKELGSATASPFWARRRASRAVTQWHVKIKPEWAKY